MELRVKEREKKPTECSHITFVVYMKVQKIGITPFDDQLTPQKIFINDSSDDERFVFIDR